jgi:hypothetical protein
MPCHLSINSPRKCGKEKSPPDENCQCEKEMDDHLLARQYFIKESHAVTRLANDRASILNINDINFLERLTAIIVVL